MTREKTMRTANGYPEIAIGTKVKLSRKWTATLIATDYEEWQCVSTSGDSLVIPGPLGMDRGGRFCGYYVGGEQMTFSLKEAISSFLMRNRDIDVKA